MASTVADVRAILPDDTQLTDEQIQAAIDAATCVVDRMVLGCMAGFPQECIDQVCTYLAAHFAAVTENTLSIKSETDPCCGGSVVYGFKFGTGYLGTPFGQMANMLSGGCLSQQDKPVANFFSIGC